MKFYLVLLIKVVLISAVLAQNLKNDTNNVEKLVQGLATRRFNSLLNKTEKTDNLTPEIDGMR